ncbi:MAG: AraC family transcriptional regulator [Lachnospiraceae bacterium]|nr:AraC family transcriptional regulator [Lachnospiraceae bacterium]
MSDFQFSIFPNENFVDLSMYQFGQEKTDPSHSYGPAARNHYLFHYILSGAGMLAANDSRGETQTYHIKSGQGFMIFPNQITTYVSDNHLPWEYVWIEFDGLRVKEALSIAGLSIDQPIYKARLKDLREDMMQEMLYISNHSDSAPFHLIGHLYLFFDALLRSITPEQQTNSKKLRDYYVRESLAYIEQNFQNDISVEDIAKVCGLNRSYFSKVFKEATGKSPQQFLLTYRMIKATELLKLTKLSIGDIGNAVGYANQLHFSRAFKNEYGISPREWRNNNYK